MDCSQDITGKEQCSVVIRYIDDNSRICERTVLFLECASTTGEDLFKLVKDSLEVIGLSMRDIAGFSFDGAGNMKSDAKGVNHFIKLENPRSLYLWCFAHRMNIVVKHSISFGPVKYLLGLASNTASFIRKSYKRMNIWTETVQNLKNYDSRTKLKIIGGTRWSAEHDALHNIVRTELHLFVVIKSLLKICNMDSTENEALIL